MLVLKPTPVSSALTIFGPFDLYLFNANGDILLKIWYSTRCIIFNDGASLEDNWVEEQKVDMQHVDLKARSVL